MTTDSDRHADGLPRLTAVRPRATTANGEAAVELRFENGARIRYRATSNGIREEWFDSTAEEPVRSHAVTDAVPHGAGGQGDTSTDGRPDTRALTDRALCTVGSYLAFESRKQAAFTWGDANVAVLCDEV